MALVVVALGLTWWFTSRVEPPSTASTEVSEERTPARSGEFQTVPPLLGLLAVDASPWGKITRISDSDGNEWPLPDERRTPLALRLPPGSYEIALAHPDLAKPRTCDASVAIGHVGRCWTVLVELTPEEYLKEAGW